MQAKTLRPSRLRDYCYSLCGMEGGGELKIRMTRQEAQPSAKTPSEIEHLMLQFATLFGIILLVNSFFSNIREQISNVRIDGMRRIQCKGGNGNHPTG